MRRGLAAVLIGLAGSVIALAPATGAGAAGDPAVTISSSCGGPAFCFTPSTLTISDGDTVTWTNSSGAEHFVGRCDPAGCNGAGGGTGTDATFTPADAADVPDGATYSHTFNGAGTYTYFCAIHGYAAMHGVIVVNGAAPSTTATTPASAAPSTTAQSATSAPTPGSLPASTPESVAATTRSSAVDPSLAATGHDTGGTLALGIGALVLGLAARGVCTPRRGVVSRLRR
jgi:plastocyanin